MKLLQKLLLLLFVAAALPAAAQTEPRTIEYEGNIITIEVVNTDTFEVEDPETGKMVFMTKHKTRFGTLNGNKIYQGTEAEEPKGRTSQPNLRGFLEQLLDDELKSTRGTFGHLELVISEKGELAY